MSLGEIAEIEPFLDRLGETIRAHNILRLKGFAAVAGKPMRLVIQAVGPRVDSYFVRPFGNETRDTQLVVIGLDGMDEAAIRASLA